MNTYYSMVRTGKTLQIDIYGDIMSYAMEDAGEVSAHNLSRQLREADDVSVIDVHISSYGGEVKEGLAIYNALKQHTAKVVTHCDGFACSIASVVFMAGDERIMSDASLLMIHNAWTCAMGNAAELRKQADDLEKITQASVAAYMQHATVSEDEVKRLMDAETWISPDEAVQMGFATETIKEKAENAHQSALHKLYEIVMAAKDAQSTEYENKKCKDKQEDTDEEKPVTDDSGEPDDDTDEMPDRDDDEIPDDDKRDPEDGKHYSDESENQEKDKATKADQKLMSFFNAIYNN